MPGAGSLARAPAPDVTLWVTLGDFDQLVEVDACTFKEIRRITTDPNPHGLAEWPDGPTRILVARKVR